MPFRVLNFNKGGIFVKRLILLSIIMLLVFVTACENKTDEDTKKTSAEETTTTEEELLPEYNIPEPEMLTFYSVDEMIEWNDICGVETNLVVGEFVTDDLPLGDVQGGVETDFFSGESKCQFKITRVLEGDLQVGETITIVQKYYYEDTEHGGKELHNNSYIRPMKKGDKWVYFLTYYEDYLGYRTTFTIQGRFPVPPSKDSSADDLSAFEMGLYKKYDYCDAIYNDIVNRYDWD